ncbi:hypothetical protein [Xanthobacter sp. KR7-225]|uniref:hypothetical protein n=1 Tax=Xanthobacter sp. KR7-225 TaxID=3156613 RepID=UPI0032B3D9E4
MKTTLALAAVVALLTTQAAFADPSVTRENHEAAAVAAQSAARDYNNPFMIFTSQPQQDPASPVATALNPVEDPHWGPAADGTDN